jgi:hypothetical protein
MELSGVTISSPLLILAGPYSFSKYTAGDMAGVSGLKMDIW